MKIIVGSNGKSKLKMTKKEWINLAQKAGWLNEDQIKEAKKKKKYKHSPKEHGFIEECINKNKSKVDDPGAYCVLPGTLILGDNKSMIHYEMGNSVIGVNGLQSVMETFGRTYNGFVYRIKAESILPIIVTPEHPILSVESIDSYGHIRGFKDKEWTRASELVAKEAKKDGHYLLMPRLKGHIKSNEINVLKYIKSNRNGFITNGKRLVFPLNEETAWMLGLFVAEGSSSEGHSDVGVCLNHNEFYLQNRFSRVIASLGLKPRIRKHSTMTKVEFSSKILNRAFRDWCGTKSTNKKIPEFILLHKNLNILQSFINGYIDGDGCRYDKGIKMSTVSELLAIQLQLAFARLGKIASICKIDRGERCSIQGREVNCNLVYSLHVFETQNSSKQINKKRIKDNFIYFPIRTIEKIKYNGIVNNIETSDNTYLVSNCIVHNCASIVDKAKGTTEWRKGPKD